MTDTLFSDPNLSVAATYCPQGGEEISLRVLRPSQENTEFRPFGSGATRCESLPMNAPRRS